MRVTVVIAARDRADTLMEAVESVLAQDHPCRLYIVDDGSDDDTGKVIEALDRKGVPLTLRRHSSPAGQGRARNEAVRDAWEGTDVFAFLDADDLYYPGKVSSSLRAFARDPRAGLVYADEDYSDAVSGLAFPRLREPFSRERLERVNIVGGNFLVSRAALAAAGLFDESFRVAETHALAWAVSKTHALAHVPEVLASVRADARSLRHSVPPAEWAASGRRAVGGKP